MSNAKGAAIRRSRVTCSGVQSRGKREGVSGKSAHKVSALSCKFRGERKLWRRKVTPCKDKSMSKCTEV